MVRSRIESPFMTPREPIEKSPMKSVATVDRIISILEEYKRQSKAIVDEATRNPREWPNFERFRAVGRYDMADELLNRINHEVKYVAND